MGLISCGTAHLIPLAKTKVQGRTERNSCKTGAKLVILCVHLRGINRWLALTILGYKLDAAWKGEEERFASSL